MNKESYDLVIIGAGPGGYVAAIRAAQLGMRVALVEKRDRLGGTCLNIGCIPSKALLDSSERLWAFRNSAGEHGIEAKDVVLNLDQMQSRKSNVVDQLTSGVQALMKKNKVDVVRGTGVVDQTGEVAVHGNSQEKSLSAQNIILAEGSIPQELPFLPFDGTGIVSSTEALSFNQVPERLLVVGAGAIGLELGSVWARLGSEVTVIEIMNNVLPGWDLQVARTLKRELERQGLDLHLSTKVTGKEMQKGTVVLKAEQADGKPADFRGEKVLVAVGRKANLSPQLQKLGIEVAGGRIKVDSTFQTNVKGIYAIGDLIHGPMLAHKAEEEGIACVEILAGTAGHVNYETIPNIVYTWPEAASVGKTEEQLKTEKIPYKKGTFQFRANGRALAAGDTEGFVKILGHTETDRILGAHILGPMAATLIAEIVAVMEFGGSTEDIARTVHGHPTLSEAIREAALAVDNRSIHS